MMKKPNELSVLWEENMICQMCFESEAMENSTVCKECSDSMIDKGFELRCLNCGSTNCIISPKVNCIEDEKIAWNNLEFEISCVDCGQGE
jgi:hypothetical protein